MAIRQTALAGDFVSSRCRRGSRKTGLAAKRGGASAPRRPQRASNSAWGSDDGDREHRRAERPTLGEPVGSRIRDLRFEDYVPGTIQKKLQEVAFLVGAGCARRKKSQQTTRE